jgi:hypothetical protein
VGAIDRADLVRQVLQLANAVRAEAGDPLLTSLPLGSLKQAEQACPIARALSALVVTEERRMAFCYPWYAAAASKVWGSPFTDALLLSVRMPDAIYEFAVAFRAGAFPELVQTSSDFEIGGPPKASRR